MRRRVQQLHHHWETVVETHGVLGHLCVLVARGQVTQGADGRLRDVFSVAGPEHRPHQGLDASDLVRINANMGVINDQDCTRTHARTPRQSKKATSVHTWHTMSLLL